MPRTTKSALLASAITALIEAGVSERKVARTLGISTTVVRYVLGKTGWNPARQAAAPGSSTVAKVNPGLNKNERS